MKLRRHSRLALIVEIREVEMLSMCCCTSVNNCCSCFGLSLNEVLFKGDDSCFDPFLRFYF